MCFQGTQFDCVLHSSINNFTFHAEVKVEDRKYSLLISVLLTGVGDWSPSSYFLRMRYKFWCHITQALSTSQMTQIISWEFVTSKFVLHSHPQEVWTGLKSDSIRQFHWLATRLDNTYRIIASQSSTSKMNPSAVSYLFSSWYIFTELYSLNWSLLSDNVFYLLMLWKIKWTLNLDWEQNFILTTPKHACGALNHLATSMTSPATLQMTSELNEP